MPNILYQRLSEGGTEHGYGQMVIGTATVFGAAAFGGILLLYNEKPVEVYTKQDSRTRHSYPASIRFSLLVPLRPAAG